MQGIDQVLGASGMNIDALAAKFGLSPEQASAAMGALMPAVLGGFQKKADADDLAPVTTAAAATDAPSTDFGNGVLGHIFGSKDVSRQVSDHAAGQSGVSSTIVQAMLPIVAAMVAKHLAGGATTSGSGGLLGGVLGSILGGGGGAGGLGGMLGGGGSGGNPLDQILARMR